MATAQSIPDPKGFGALKDALLTVTLCIGLLVVYHKFFAAPDIAHASEGGNSGPAHNIVVVDTEVVLKGLMAKMQQRVSTGEAFNEGQLNVTGAEFAADYLRVIKEYRDKGYLVIDRKYALGIPEGSEVTESIGNLLGLQVERRTDFLSAPSLN